MRRVTQQEGESWRTLAQQHGFGSAEGRFVLGRFIVEARDENGLVLSVVTPIRPGSMLRNPSSRRHPSYSRGPRPMRSLCRDAGGN